MRWRAALAWLADEVGGRTLIVVLGLASLSYGLWLVEPVVAWVGAGALLIYIGLWWRL